MKTNKLFSLILCIVILFCTSACKNGSGDLSSDVSIITETEIIYENIDDTSENSSDDTSSGEVSQNSPSVDETSSENYGFNRIRTVEYECLEDIPNGNARYEVTSVMTDSGIDIVYSSDFSSNVSGVVVDGEYITVPYSYRKNNSSITVTAKHKASGISKDFVITFNKWTVVFEDNFDGNKLDTTKWDYCPSYPRDKGYANLWNKEMTFVKDGYLVSRVLNTGEQDTSNRTWNKLANPNDKTIYKSGAVWSKDLFESAYGYYEISAKPHQTTGMWGAFWLITGDMDHSNPIDDNSAVNGAEIDIFESLKNLGINHAIHWDGWSGYGNSMKGRGYFGKHVFDGKFHTFALRWSPDEYIFLIDGEITLRVEGYDAGGICEAKGYLNITSECGTWGDKITLGKGEYSDMLVDYVRVYTTDGDIK